MVRSRTSTAPGSSDAVAPRGWPGCCSTPECTGGRGFSSGGATSSAICSAVSVDWRWGRTTCPIGWMVAARGSTRTVRSLAATGSMVTTAQRAATSAGSDAGSPQNTTDRASNGSAAASARSAASSGSSLTRIVSDQAQDPTAARAARHSAGAASPRRGSTSPGSSGTSQVPSASSPMGSTTGTYGKERSRPSRAAWPTCHAEPSCDAHEAGGRLFGVRAGEREGDAGVRDADGADRRGRGSAVQGPAQ